MVVIESIHARQIFDSRGNPTVEVDLKTAKGKKETAIFILMKIIPGLKPFYSM